MFGGEFSELFTLNSRNLDKLLIQTFISIGSSEPIFNRKVSDDCQQKGQGGQRKGLQHDNERLYCAR